MKSLNKHSGYALYAVILLCLIITQIAFYYFTDGTGRVEGLTYIFVTSSILIALPALIQNRKVIYIVFLLIDILLYVNILYYRNYSSLIPIDSFQIRLSDLLLIRTSAANSTKAIDILLFMPLLAVFIVDFLTYKKLPLPKKQLMQAAIGNMLLLVLFIGVTIVPRFNTLYGDYQNRFFWDRLKGAHGFSYFIYLFNDYSNRPKDIQLSADDLSSINNFLADGSINDKPAENGNTQKEKNVILVLVESLETFPINQAVEGLEITPFLNTLIKDSLSFFVPKVVTQVGAGRSSDGQLIVNTGLLPLENGIAAFMSDRKYISLSSLLKESHHQQDCITAHALSSTFWNQSNLSIMLSYGKTYCNKDFKQDDMIDGTISDESIFRQTIPILKSLNKPFLAQLITMSSHDMIDIGKKKNFTISNEYDWKIAHYLEIINYVDGAIAELFSSLKDEGLLENTTVVITGDHNVFNRKDYDEKTASLMSEEYNFIPLIIYNSHKSGGYNEVIGQVDIFPTLLDALYIQSEWRGIGTSIFSDNPPQVALNHSLELIGKEAGSIDRLREAWKISDLIIKGNYFKLDNSLN